MKAAEISLTALDVEWRRLEIIAENLANASSARAADGQVYRARHLVSGPAGEFRALLDGQQFPAGIAAGHLRGIEAYGVELDDRPPRHFYDPGNPAADADGFVVLPEIDEAQQMTLLIRTARHYEANLVALNVARQMYAKGLELGRQG
jgi:flagellar basal-body rod protein FlgC